MVKKNLTRLAVAAILMLSLCACAPSGGGEKKIDIGKLADELQTEIEFQDQLSEMSSSMLGAIYGLEDSQLAKQMVLVSSGATAEEIALFEAKDEAGAEEIRTAVDNRIADQKESFRNYVPDELNKLEDPLIYVSGNYVVLCVSNDTEDARKIVEKAFG